MPKVFLVRHAKAGDRGDWTKPDHLRPLTKSGWKQAEGLVDLLRDEPIEVISSSPYVRCVQTVEPLATARGLELRHEEALAEGAFLEGALLLIGGADVPTVLCTHGDVLTDVVSSLREMGTPGADESLGKKGSTWVFEVADGNVARATYMPPP